MNKLPNTTLVFLVKRENRKISEICLAMKKRGFGKDKWNGVGGKVKENETVIEAARRETKEEINIETVFLEQVGVIDFLFKNNCEWNQQVHVFICEKWKGEIKESEEMLPEWFDIKGIPYGDMWIDDPYWLPKILLGEKIKARFIFENQEEISEKKIVVCGSGRI